MRKSVVETWQEVDSGPLLEAAETLFGRGFEAREVAELFCNLSAVMLHRCGRSREAFVGMAAQIWEHTQVQLAELDAEERLGVLMTRGGEA